MPNQAPTYGLILKGEKLVVTRAGQSTFFDPRFLIAALLEHVARGDGEITDDESREIVDLVADHFQLDTDGAGSKLSHALNLYSRNMDLEAVGELLGEILEPEERGDVMLMLLKVVAADGRQGADELRAVDEVAEVLSITAEERHAAFQIYFSRHTTN